MKPSIFEYENYREFLKEMFAHKKEHTPSFSYRWFARKAGLATPSFLKHVMTGERNLSNKTIVKFAKAFDLNREETEFFENLVRFNQAEQIEEKTHYYERMGGSRRYRKANGLSKEQFRYYSKWYYSAVRELVTMSDFREDPTWIARMIHPPITVKQAEKALSLLIKLGILRRDESKRLVQSHSFVSTGPEVLSVAVAKFHQEMLRRSSEAMETVSAEERDISALTIGVPKEHLPVLKEMIVSFRKEIGRVFGNEEKPIEQVYQLNLQLFPITAPSSKKKKEKTNASS